VKLPENIKTDIINQCTFSASRSGGPGGQNVNKVNTKIEVRLVIQACDCFSEKQKQLIRCKLKNRISNDDELVLFESSERSQLRNKEKVSKRLILLIQEALTPVKKRIRTKPTAGSKQKRLLGKKLQAQKKQLRQKPNM